MSDHASRLEGTDLTPASFVFNVQDVSAAQGSLQARLGQKAADWALNKERRKVSGEGAGGMATEGRKEEGKEGEGGNNAGGQGEGIKALRELPLQEVQKRLRALGKPITYVRGREGGRE